MGPDDLLDDLSDDEQPRVKIHPPIFKGTPGERPDAHIMMQQKTGWKQ